MSDPTGAWRERTPPDRAEVARPYFERQAQRGRRVIFHWNPARDWPHNPLTTPWPGVEDLIEGVTFADEAAARRFDLDHMARAGGVPPDAGPFRQFDTWEEALGWLQEGDATDR